MQFSSVKSARVSVLHLKRVALNGLAVIVSSWQLLRELEPDVSATFAAM